MLSEHADRIRTGFAVDFEPQFGVTVAKAADEVYRKYKPAEAGSQPLVAYVYRWPEERRFLVIAQQRVVWETLGLSAWRDHLDDHTAVVRTVLNAVGAKRLKRIGFRVMAYLPLHLSHAEMIDLLFGSFLASRQDLEGVGGDVTDSLVHLEGKHHGLEYMLWINPSTRQQVSEGFLASPNLDLFIQRKFLDPGVKDFHEQHYARRLLVLRPRSMSKRCRCGHPGEVP